MSFKCGKQSGNAVSALVNEVGCDSEWLEDGTQLGRVFGKVGASQSPQRHALQSRGRNTFQTGERMPFRHYQYSRHLTHLDPLKLRGCRLCAGGGQHQIEQTCRSLLAHFQGRKIGQFQSHPGCGGLKTLDCTRHDPSGERRCVAHP
jgi:hypothetical protein